MWRTSTKRASVHRVHRGPPSCLSSKPLCRKRPCHFYELLCPLLLAQCMAQTWCSASLCWMFYDVMSYLLLAVSAIVGILSSLSLPWHPLCWILPYPFCPSIIVVLSPSSHSLNTGQILSLATFTSHFYTPTQAEQASIQSYSFSDMSLMSVSQTLISLPRTRHIQPGP